MVLVGTTGSGKSTFAARHFAATQVLSSDYCRGLVSDDENDQSASADAFGLLHHIAGDSAAARIAHGGRCDERAAEGAGGARAVARAHDVLPVAIVLDVPEEVCRERNAVRPDRAMGPHVISRQRREMRSNLRNLEREGFRKVHILRGVAEIDEAVFEFEKAYNDKRELTGPFDVIGDIHGCRSELETLLAELGYEVIVDDSGRAVDAVPPECAHRRVRRRPCGPWYGYARCAAAGDGHGRGRARAVRSREPREQAGESAFWTEGAAQARSRRVA